MDQIYDKPPVIEAWIEFHFEYGEEVPKWDQNIAIQFVKSLGEQFNQEEHGMIFRKDFKFNVSNGSIEIAQSAPIFERIKTFNTLKDRCLQAEKNLLVYNMLRKDIKWPGFPVLLQEVLPIQQKYLDNFCPIKIGKIVLHYRDNVTVPFENGRIEPRDYFEIYPHTPKEIGDMAHYSLSLTLPNICENGVMQFSVKTVPCITEKIASQLSFMIDWNINSTVSFDCNNMDMCEGWLNLAHGGITKAFKECLTEKCRKLFS